MIRRKYRFYGKVQEVGFRTTVMNMAVVLHITGTIENQDDFSVVAYLQGNEHKIDILIHYLQDYPPFDITKIDYVDESADLSENSFRIIDRYITKE